jgi:hypothetical protein
MNDWGQIRNPVFLHGNRRVAYRDPAAFYHLGLFRVFHTQVHRDEKGLCFLVTAVTKSEDLVTWTLPEILTPKNQALNYSSPGNVIRSGKEWLLCLQTYPTPHNEPTGDRTARVFVMRSPDLDKWSEPEMLRVKGEDVPREEMGRMIDPYLIADKDDPEKWWCFYKQNGASMSFSHDLKTWTYFGRVEAGENVCIVVEKGEYVLFHSPKNGVGIKRSSDFQTWREGGLLTLGQPGWPWAHGRLTAGHVLDLREEPAVGKAVMFFHGSSEEGTIERETHGHASLAMAWSEDLIHWQWPG